MGLGSEDGQRRDDQPAADAPPACPRRRIRVVDPSPGVVEALLQILAELPCPCDGGAPGAGITAGDADVLVVGPLCPPEPVLAAASTAAVVVVTTLPPDERAGDWVRTAAIVETGRLAAELVPAVRRACGRPGGWATADRCR